jgi:AcrR family transcriptional regulator
MLAGMNDALDPLAVAKQPTQQRAKERFDRILAEAEALLNENGLSGFSIPAIAERLGYTRGSIYAYFPTPYAVLNELVKRYLAQLEAEFFSRAEELRALGWREGIAAVVDVAVAFHNSHPAARLLILGGAVTDDSYRAQELTNKRLGQLCRRSSRMSRRWSSTSAPPASGARSSSTAGSRPRIAMRRSGR